MQFCITAYVHTGLLLGNFQLFLTFAHAILMLSWLRTVTTIYIQVYIHCTCNIHVYIQHTCIHTELRFHWLICASYIWSLLTCRGGLAGSWLGRVTHMLPHEQTLVSKIKRFALGYLLLEGMWGIVMLHTSIGRVR